MPFQFRQIAADGLHFNVGLMGESAGNAPPLLLLNGIGFNAGLMQKLADALPGRRIICPEMPGCGKSPDPALPYTMASAAVAIVSVMEKLCGDARFDCLGFSWGGALAQQIAVQAQHRLSRLVLVSTTSGVPLPMADPEILFRLFDPREYLDPRRMHRNFTAMLREGGAGAGLLRRFTTPGPAGVSSQLVALAGWSAAPLLPFVRVPVLLAGTADDPVVPIVHQRVLSCLLPQAQNHELRSGGHLLPLATPDRIAGRVLEFLHAKPERMAA